MEHMIDCMELMEESWNKWGSVRIEYIIGTGPMRDKKGNILPQSWLGDYEVHKFRVGVRPPIYCIWDGENLTLTKYGRGYSPPIPPENSP